MFATMDLATKVAAVLTLTTVLALSVAATRRLRARRR